MKRPPYEPPADEVLPTLPPLPAETTHFYRYQSPAHLDRLERILLKHDIYLPDAAEMNDPDEAKPKFAKLSDYWATRFLREFHGSRKSIHDKPRKQRLEEIDTFVRLAGPDELHKAMSESFYESTSGTRFFCMSLRWNNMGMWAKYADNHKGYCLEFARAGVFVAAQRVLYDDSFRLNVTNPKHITHIWYFLKHPDWQTEEEVRVIAPKRMAGPYFPFEPEHLTRIILGKDMSATDSDQILKWADERTPKLKVSAAQYEQHTRTLRLVEVGNQTK